MKYWLSILLMGTLHTVFAQSNIPIGTWQSHLPYNAGIWVTQSPEKIIYTTEWSLLVIDKQERSLQEISKVDGLSDVGIDLVDYDERTDQLVIIYSNGNIDLFSNDGTTNLPNILTNQNITGDKNIYAIHTSIDGFAYLSTGFGLVQIDLDKREFGFTTFTGVKVNDVTTTDTHIYMSTDDGSYVAPLSENVNLGDFTKWSFLGDESGLPIVYQSNYVSYFNDAVYMEIDNVVYRLDGDNFIEFFSPKPNFEIAYLSNEGAHLIIGTIGQGSESSIYFVDQRGEITEHGNSCVNRTRYAVEDQQGNIWYADGWSAFRNTTGLSDDCNRIQVNSPKSHELSKIAIKDNEVFVASGGVSDVFNYRFSREGIYMLKEGVWTNRNENNVSFIKENALLNFYEILPHPTINTIYMGTYWGGVLAWDRDADTYRLYDDTNSSLQGAIGDEQRERVSGLAFDMSENLWVSNYGAGRPLSVLTASGDWYNFAIPNDQSLVDIVVDNNNYKWVAVHGNMGGVLIYDDNFTPENSNDDRQRFINSNNSELTTNRVNTVAVDLDGSVWVGTSEGVVLYECGVQSFDDDCVGRRIKVLQDSIAAFLLADVEITDIAIDGANRKWFASKNGIFVQSPDGQNQELRFTTDNSPLFDNSVIDLAYNGDTGDMYIGTDKGLQTYRTATSSARPIHSNNVYSFPNPVPPDYRGPIAIKGLAQDADVKITDINGKLVFETVALGGQAIWDGTIDGGVRAETGVYLVFSVADNAFGDVDSFVTKILLVAE